MGDEEWLVLYGTARDEQLRQAFGSFVTTSLDANKAVDRAVLISATAELETCARRTSTSDVEAVAHLLACTRNVVEMARNCDLMDATRAENRPSEEVIAARRAVIFAGVRFTYVECDVARAALQVTVAARTDAEVVR